MYDLIFGNVADQVMINKGEYFYTKCNILLIPLGFSQIVSFVLVFKILEKFIIAEDSWEGEDDVQQRIPIKPRALQKGL